MRPIIFDKTSTEWDKNPDYNLLILRRAFDWLEDRFKYRGYLYLNQIYDALGIKWDPDDENICYKKENGPIDFNYEQTCFGEYRILITQ